MDMRSSLSVLMLALCCAVWAASGVPAAAAVYAGIDDVPVKGGELRIDKPLTVELGQVDGSVQTAQVIALPLKRTRVEIEVAGIMGLYTIEQTFENPFDEPIEAVYVFPLGDDAAVNAYEIVIGERTIKGVIKRREEARQEYEQAKTAGHTAAPLEREKPNIFAQSIANIFPRETITVRIRYAELLDYVDQRYELVFPTVVGPRYLPATETGRRPVGAHEAGQTARPGVVSIPYLEPGTYAPPEIELSVRIDAGVPVADPVSPSHSIMLQRADDTRVEVQLDPNDRVPNRDFILRYSVSQSTSTVGLLTHRSNDDGEGYFVLMIQPKHEYTESDITGREVILLINTSGSMTGAPLQLAGYAAREVLGSLRPADTFNIYTFASDVKTLSQGPIAADAAGLERGRAWIDQLRASGGTEMKQGVLRTLHSRPGEDRIRQIYVLTDGFVGNDDVVLGAVQRAGSHNRIFPVGIGSAPNRYLIDRLAEIGRGFPSYLTLREAAQEVVDQLVRRTTYPYLTDVQIDWDGLQVSDVLPEVIPDVHAGQPVVVAGRYRTPGSGELRLSASIAGRPIETVLTAELPANHEEPAVAYLWARRRVHELMASDYGNISSEVRSKVTEIGLSFGLVTEFTSFLAIDETRVTQSNGTIRTIHQPVPCPEGVDFKAAVAGQQLPQGYAGTSYAGGGNSYSGGGSDSSYDSGHSGGFSFGLGSVDPLTLALAGVLASMAWRRRRS